MPFRIRPLDGDIAVGGFGCGEIALDEYIRRYASQDVRRGIARVFVATPEDDSHLLAGFYSLSAGSVRADDLPESVRCHLPRYPIPVALLGRLAVDVAFPGQGVGAVLLADACLKVAQASHVLAVTGLIVGAKTESAAAFYRHFGFVDLPGQSGRLLLPGKAFLRRGRMK